MVNNIILAANEEPTEEPMEDQEEPIDLATIMKSVTFDLEATRQLIHDEFGSDSSDNEETAVNQA